ncbi:amino acid permease [Fusibacter sp. 3D3]|uniref:amino acid permease n=1 Tax=Fusibacter sp. 3D3 TaxID=1048380 RepID=UPI000853A4D2|nr:amino acid permease [Fusibacter sp. 3D3]GAU76540.1 putative Na-K-Cl cotransporter [Fusibacter sp. 3D3]
MTEVNRKAGLKTFEGVYTPTLLTILGVILYLRLGWVVGNVGLIATIVIIVLAHMITLTTALSMSSMLTNIKIGSGGAYAIITRSLGLEMGGAIGIPLYLSQTFSIAFYITGFSELWITFFPNHSQVAVGIGTWFVLSAISMKSAKLAFRLQYGILVAVGLSLISFFIGPNLNEGSLVLKGSFQMSEFWKTFAIFFPAVTGVLTGATMSGDLENPRESIIKGTLAAIFTGFGVYLFVAFWFAHQATQEMLLTDPSIIFKLAGVKGLIIAGVMGAVLSSALSTLVSAPRTLSALAENRVVPFSNILGKQTASGEPLNAIMLSSIISLIVIVAGNLNSLAELLTMFFLTTYGMINIVVFLEQFTGVISYRPSLKMTILVPIMGALGCLSVMLLINPLFTIVTFVIIGMIYSYLKTKNLVSPWGDVRGGIFISVAEWAAQKVSSSPYHPRLWKPSIAIPVEKPEDFKRLVKIVYNLAYPSGRVYYLTSTENQIMNQSTEKEIERVLNPLKEKRIFVQKTIITSPDFESIIAPTLQCMKSSFLPPNIVLFTVSDNKEKQDKLKQIIKSIQFLKTSYCCLWIHPKMGFGIENKINLWLRSKSPNNDLAVLCALQLSRNFGAELNLCRVVRNEAEQEETVKKMLTFVEDARLPVNTKVRVLLGSFHENIVTTHADLNIIGMPVSYESMIEIIDIVPSSALFVSSIGHEDVML